MSTPNKTYPQSNVQVQGNETYGWVTISGSPISNWGFGSGSYASDVMTVQLVGAKNVTVTINVSGITGTIQFFYNYWDPTQEIAVSIASTSLITSPGYYYLQVINPPTRWFRVNWNLSGVATISISYYANT